MKAADHITNQTYDRIAADFAERYWNVVLEQALNSFSKLVGGERLVMDLGCGPGRDVGLLRERGLTVFGADRSIGMLREAQRRVSGAFINTDMRHLPLRTSSLDGVWMCASLLHIPRVDVPGVLAEVHRVLTTNGVLYLSVQEGTGEAWMDTDGGKRFFTYFSASELQNLLSDAGFSIHESWVNPGAHHPWLSVLGVRH
jgi:ubiquinone/menaquinone biosynthesis C-methylase UbiE